MLTSMGYLSRSHRSPRYYAPGRLRSIGSRQHHRKMFDVATIWRDMTTDLRTVSIPQCCHLPHEERPDVVNAALLGFLEGWKG